MFITGSFDATCKIWDTDTCDMIQNLKGHKKTVYSVSFNMMYGYIALYVEIELPQGHVIRHVRYGMLMMESVYLL